MIAGQAGILCPLYPSEFSTSTKSLQDAGDKYYQLAEALGTDYAAMRESNPAEVSTPLDDAKSAWMAASPL